MRPMGFTILIMVFFICACNWQPNTSDEGLTVQNTNVHSFISGSDSLHMPSDTLNKDSLFTDTLMMDNTRNLDTTRIIPLQQLSTKNVQPHQLIAFSKTLIGIPYVWGSTDPKVGFDCSGFITHVFNHFNIDVPRSSIDFTGVGEEIKVKEAKEGDIILFTGTNPLERFVGHMGIVVSNTDTLRFIHSTSGKAMGVTITPLNKYYENRFVKTIRVFK